jgi:hypothetical protein
MGRFFSINKHRYVDFFKFHPDRVGVIENGLATEEWSPFLDRVNDHIPDLPEDDLLFGYAA